MTKNKKIVIAIIALALAFGLFIGVGYWSRCESEKIPVTKVCDIIKKEFPEAHISENRSLIFLTNDDELSVRFYPEEDTRRGFFEVEHLKSVNDVKHVLNTFMPIYRESWSNADADRFLSVAQPDEAFTRWEHEEKCLEGYEFNIETSNYINTDGLSFMVHLYS